MPRAGYGNFKSTHTVSVVLCIYLSKGPVSHIATKVSPTTAFVSQSVYSDEDRHVKGLVIVKSLCVCWGSVNMIVVFPNILNPTDNF